MKIKSFFVSALLACTLGASAALPNPLMFNTAVNTSFSGVVGLGNAGLWQASLTNMSGPFYPAKQAFVSGWAGSPSTLASWVTYPQHNCSGATNIAEHWCQPASPANPTGVKGDVEEFYKINFELPAYVCGKPITQKDAYILAIKFWADNLVYKVWINGTLFFTGTSAATYNLNDNHSSLSYGQAMSLNQYWVAGTNEIMVEVLSGAPNNLGWSGFMAIADPANTTKEPCGDGTSCCLGNYCGSSINALYGNYELPLNSNSFFYSGDASKSDKVNVGMACSTAFPGKFNVTTAQPSDASGSGSDSYSIYGTNTSNANNSTNTGVYGSAICAAGESTKIERGVWGIANGGMDARGVFGQGKTATRSYGGYFESINSNQGTNYGIYATAANASTANWAGFFQGNIYVAGTPYSTSGGMWSTSDSRFKKNVKPLTNVTEKLMKIKGYTYQFKTEEFPDKNFAKEEQIGVIAQELKEVFPQMVTEKDGYNYVNYSALIPVLLEGLKEQNVIAQKQNEINEQQQKQIEELKTLVQSMAGVSGAPSNSAGTPVSLSDKNSVVLNQNVPNPFAESTVITYNVPSDFTKAQIIFTTNEGKVIKSVEITVKGAGSLNVFANDLSHGIYSYSLVVDGKTIDTKKMIKE